jgi:tripartite-type tricarboxylate transporter receptor subunit TctC
VKAFFRLTHGIALAVAALLLFGGFGLVHAQEPKYPSKTIHIIVPFPPGALTDIVARMYAEKLANRLGQSVIVENRPGAGGVIASQAALSAPADGYALLMVSSAHAVNSTLYTNLPYDTSRDFKGISLVASSPNVVIIRPDFGARTVRELIEVARKNPGKLNYGSAGVGSATHLVGAYFVNAAHIDVVHVPYKGGQDMISEVMAGRLDMAFPPIALAIAQIRANRVTGVAVTSSERSQLLPDVPTVQESGLPGFEFSIWYAMVASSKTPKPILEQLAREMAQIGEMPDMRERMVAQGLIPKSITLGELDLFIKSEVDKMGRLVKATAAKPE